MSDAIDKAFERALARSMGDEDPVESAKLVHVSQLAFSQQEKVRAALEAQMARFVEQTSGLIDTDPKYKAAQEIHNLLVDSYKQQLKLLQKVGNPRGF